MFDDRAHVAGAKTVLGEVLGEDDALMELEGHGSFSGISVTSRGVVTPAGVIQIDWRLWCRSVP